MRLYLSVVRRRARPALPDCSGFQAQIIAEAQRKLYGQGVMAGMQITLELLLGISSSGGRPFAGDLPDDVREWAQTVLRAIKGAQT